MTIEFHCKDPLLAKHYEHTFGDQFADHLTVMVGPPMSEIRAYWEMCMLEEALRQEHYDYTEDDRGVRTPIREADGTPKLLIPDLKVVE